MIGSVSLNPRQIVEHQLSPFCVAYIAWQIHGDHVSISVRVDSVKLLVSTESTQLLKGSINFIQS